MKKIEFGKIRRITRDIIRGGTALAIMFGLSGSAPRGRCVSFWEAANIDYTPAVWNDDAGLFESVFRQKSKRGERGWVYDIDRTGNTRHPIIVFPIGADVAGYSDTTITRRIRLPDGTFIDSYTTEYCPVGNSQ
ncbi:hypothetical protein KJZ67_00980 [Patescibacteria group bacterium]|nr:hypothetical protein [Patescibacteria group bacterium]